MKVSHFRACSSSRRGVMVILLALLIGISSTFVAVEYAKKALRDFQVVRTQAIGFKADALAKAGFQGGISAIRKIPEEYLYRTGIAFNPPPIPLGGGKIYYRISAEDGKINLNTLINMADDQLNLRTEEMVIHLFQLLGLKKNMVYPIEDWLDTNSQETGGGAEKQYYQKLKPPRKIKNGPMYNISELLAVKDFTRKNVFGSLKPKEKDDGFSKSFQSEEEKVLITDRDYVLANNLTAFLPFQLNYDDRINLNAAPYFVLMSLSYFMTKVAAERVLKLRLTKGGYIKNVQDLRPYAEFKVNTSGGLTLYQELAGDGSSVSNGRIRTKGEVYRITAVGMAYDLNSDGKEKGAKKKKQTGKATVRRVTGIYDKANNALLYYSED